VDVDGPEDFFDWLDRTEAKANEGDGHARRLLGRATDALNQLRVLEGPPSEDMPDLKRVRQSKTYTVWRTAHPFDPEIAFRLICWFRRTVRRWSLRCSRLIRRGWVMCSIAVSVPALMWQFNSGSMKLRRRVMSDKRTFRRMNDRISELTNSPLIADDVRRYAAEREHVNRVYAQGLADIRRAGNLTQQQLAAALSTDQGTVSRIERRHDLLLSTLRDYLVAAGAEHSRIVVERDGVEISLDLDTFVSEGSAS
jgi:DNA-binding transcriptional regulator YiaG